MTAPGHGLGAHDRRRALARLLLQGIESRTERVLLHVVGVAPEALVAPPRVYGVRACRAMTAELRHAARPGRRAHVDEQLDMIEGEQLDELIERSCRVPDRQDDSCEGSTAGTRTRFTYCEPL